MWNIETISPVKHLLRIDDNTASINRWLLLITLLTSLFEAILLPVLVSLIWVTIYKIKREMNGSEFRLCMQATHASMLTLFSDLSFRYGRLSKNMLVFIILLFLMNLLGKNVPNVLLAQVIGIHNFTEVVSNDMVLFKNDSNCMYTSCTSDLEENFALVLNSTKIGDIMRTNRVKTAYWDSSNNNTLYAVRAKIDIMSCEFIIGPSGISTNEQNLSSNNLGNVTDTPTHTGRFTSVYNAHSMTERRANLQSYIPNSVLHTIIEDRCDIPLNMFYISPNFNPNVMKMAKWLKDNGYDEHSWQSPRICQITLRCLTYIEWKKMQIVGDTPNNIKVLEVVNFNNSIGKLDELFSTNVFDYDPNGVSYGELLNDSIMERMSIAIKNWRKTIKWQGIKYRYNFLDEYERIISQSLVSSIQSMTNNVNVYVDEIKLLEAPGIWIELTILSFVIFLVSGILTFILTPRNPKMLLPLGSLDFGIISNVIFKEGDDSCTGNLPTHYNMKISWPFRKVYFQDNTEHLVAVNESSCRKIDGN